MGFVPRCSGYEHGSLIATWGLWALAALSWVSPAAAQTQRVPLRSGAGAVEVVGAAAAQVVAPAAEWPAELPTAPVAQWVSAGDGGRALYATAFTVNEGEIATASLDGVFVASDGGAVGLFLNGITVGAIVASEDGGTRIAAPEIRDLLTAGPNLLYIDAPAAGLLFSAQVQVWRTEAAEATAPEVAAAHVLWEVVACTPIPGDFDGDRDVDLADYLALQDCLLGPDTPLPLACEGADLDGDGDGDLADLLIFQVFFTGSL